YTWKPEGFNGPDPTELLLGKPVVAGLSGQGMGLSAAKSIVNSSSDKAAKTLSLMNIKYVLFHRDANFLFLNENSWYISTSLEQFQSILSSQEGLFLEKSFGELDFYRNEYWKPMHIYATTNSTLVNGGLSQISQIVERDDFRPGESVLLLSDQLDARQLSSINGLLTPNLTDRVSMTYEEINPTKYAVHVNSTNPFFLVFSESYHKDWVAYTEEQHMPDEYHFTANGFANAWYIGKTGIYTITLEFWPQKLFYIGSAISIITVIVCTTYTGRDRIKTIYRKITKKGREKILGAISA
ncbi:hypothetical protein MUP59_08105, partial [Candidatus Bathyarchaeota archaeon]|nr:hypothetical protein [Candidatus Bathyarchaeota archaeon]